MQPVEAYDLSRDTYIYVMDSLGGNHGKPGLYLKNWLKMEALTRRQVHAADAIQKKVPVSG